MTCPYCGGLSHIVNTKKGTDYTVRRYMCYDCKKGFFTEESDVNDERGRFLMRECKEKQEKTRISEGE